MNATVKRKFNALLQGIGTNSRPSTANSATASLNNSNFYDDESLGHHPNASSTSVASMAPEFDLFSKKRRVGAPNSTPSRLASVSAAQRDGKTAAATATTTISNITLRKWTPVGPGSGPETTPKYSPSDRDQLLKRLGTFQELTDWAPKPEPVSEIEWAKRGWACSGKERVKCSLCNRELAVKLNCKEVNGKEIPVLIASDIEEALVENYTELIISAHDEECLWRRRGCDASLLRLPSLPDPKVALRGLRQRYDELLGRKDFLPYEFNLRLPEGLNLDTILSQLPTTFLTEPPPSSTSSAAPAAPASTPPQVNRTALALAVLGWQGLTNARIGAVPNSASCHSCLRRLGLWMFKSREVDPETNTILVPAPMDHLDPLREHRFFCPWKSGKAQRNAGAPPLADGETDKAAWEVIVQVLRNDAFIRGKASLASSAHGRSQSTVTPKKPTGAAFTTPVRPTTSAGEHPGPSPAIEEEDEEDHRKKDRDMMARLRRVKSLFNAKAGSKLRRTASRPGTAHSTTKGGD